MKRILHISKYYYPFRGGIEQIAQDCVNSLDGKYEQKIICFNDKNQDCIDEVDGVQVIRCGVSLTISSQGLSGSIGMKLKEAILSFRPDILIFHYPNPFVARYLLKLIPPSCKLVIYWHLDIVKQKFLKLFFIRQNKRLIERADVLVATSNAYINGSKWLETAEQKCKVVPNCINVKRLSCSEEVERLASTIRQANKDKIICFAVGRHTEYKGFKYLIRAGHLLDDRFVIFIAGIGEETSKLKAEAGEDKKIHFLGIIDDVELKGYMTAMDIFCFPSISKNEAFGVALAEGMYYGKPVVTFTIPGSGVNYVSINGETGIEVPNRNVKKYADAIRKLADNAELREQYGRTGKRRVEENFLNDRYKENINRVISEL